MENASRFAKNRLTEASRAKRIARVLTVVLGTAAISLVIILAVVFLDYWLMLVPSVRIAGLVLLGAFVIGSTWLLIRIARKPTPLKEAALDAEAAKPEIGCEVSTAAEYLAGERKPRQQYEAELARALEDNAAAHLQKVQLPYMQRVIRPALIVGMLFLLAVIFSLLASGGFTALQRALFPWTTASYTQVEVLPGDIEIPLGQDLEVKSVFSGRLPREARFQWLEESGSEWQFATLKRNENGEYIYPLKNVRTVLKYRVSGSDAVSPDYTIEPYHPPEVKEWTIELEPPAYTKRSKITQSSPGITALRGSIASLRIAPNVTLSKAQLLVKDGPKIALHPTQNGFWSADLKIEKDAEFQVELFDEKGRPGPNEKFYKVHALPDEVPVVEIAEPGEDIRAAATNTVAITVKAMDDFGLDELRLVYHRLGDAEQVITAQRNGETNAEFIAEIPLSSLGLSEYELVAYHALALDNNTLDGPGIGKSDVYFIEITDKEGGDCKCQGKGERVNLLVIQKQIIADTTALAASAPPEEIEELAQRQADAIEFGRMYQEAIGTNGPPEAIQEMAAAIAQMEAAHAALLEMQARSALPPEEKALASLYQVIRLLPELGDMPTVPPPPEENEEQEERPPMLQVVLEEIKKKKEEEPENKEIAEALEEAKRLQEEHASLSIGVQDSGNASPNGAPGETQIDRSGKNDRTNESEKMAANSKNQKSESKAAAAKKAAAKKGSGKSGKGAQLAKNAGKAENQEKGDQPGDSPEPGEGGKPEENATPAGTELLAEKESELSKEAAELAEKLERIAGKDSRLGHGVPGKMRTAASRLQAAAEALGQGDTENGGTQGALAAAALESAVAMLERILEGGAERVDVSSEEAPRQFESVIAEYFKALSYDN